MFTAPPTLFLLLSASSACQFRRRISVWLKLKSYSPWKPWRQMLHSSHTRIIVLTKLSSHQHQSCSNDRETLTVCGILRTDSSCSFGHYDVSGLEIQTLRTNQAPGCLLVHVSDAWWELIYSFVNSFHVYMSEWSLWFYYLSCWRALLLRWCMKTSSLTEWVFIR